MNKIKKTLIYIVNFVWFSTTFYILVKPINEEKINLFENADKILHALIFGIMTLLVILLIKSISKIPIRAIYAIAILGTTCFGAIMEIVQLQFFERQCDFYDVIANSTGSIIGAIIFPYVYSIIHQLGARLFNHRNL